MLSDTGVRLILTAMLVFLVNSASAGTPAIPPPAEAPPSETRLAHPLGLPWRSWPVPELELGDSLAGQAFWTGRYDASLVTFQSYRDGNWEIYRMRPDRTQVTRLTFDGPADIQPRLNRGGTRLIFASNRTGNFELYTMDADGSAQVRFSWDNTDNVAPVWSPDSARIVWESYLDGQADIHMANADGSNRVRLTHSSEYDGAPAWSPDGSRIAWTAYRNGGYRVWVMQADGSQALQLSQQPYSFGAVWSPDGSQIAYDADGDGDGFQELWLMNSDGSGQRQIYKPHGWHDARVGAWSPDGKILAFTDISYAQYQGEWYWQYAALNALDLGSAELSMLGDGYKDAGPDWQATELIPPISRVMPLPNEWGVEEMPHAFGITLSGSDMGGAGLDTYDVQFRLGDAGPWQELVSNTPNAHWGMGGSPYTSGWMGQTIYFRSRARDYVGNVEAWPGRADTYTVLYSYSITGTVQDNRNGTLAGAALAIEPEPMPGGQPGISGAYRIRMLAEVPPSFQASHLGFGDLPAMSFDSWRNMDPGLNFWLPPADNVIANYGFESGDLTGWTASGSLTIEASAFSAHTGEYSAMLASLGPCPCTELRDGAISQVVTIPASLHQPTLSVVYRAGFVPETDQVYILIEGSTVMTAEVALENDAWYTWQQSWLDMQPWAGQTVTITIGARASYGALYLDETALGSWRTPRVTAISPSHVSDLSKLPLAATLTGTNFSATPTVTVGNVTLDTVTWTNEQALQVLLPTTLAPGNYDVVVTNPGGQAAGLVGGLRVGHILYLPIIGR